MIKTIRVINFDSKNELSYVAKLGLKKGIEDRGFEENKKAVQALLAKQPVQPKNATIEWKTTTGLPEGYRVG